MSFFVKQKEMTTEDIPKMKKVPFWKKKGWRIFLIVAAAILVPAIAFVCYLWATGSNVFIENLMNGSPFLRGDVRASTLSGEGDGRINILLTGMGGTKHPGGSLTDSIMVVSVDPNDKTVAMISIPRDLYVPVSGRKFSRKINEVYSIGEADSKGTGFDLMKKTVGDIFDLPIHYFINVDFEGFEKIINELGGIDVNVEKALSDPHYPDEQMKGYDPLYISAGQQHFTGEVALKYARSRESSSDFDRAERQQIVLKAVKEKASKLGFLANPKKILDIIAIIGSHLRTDMTPSEMKSFMLLAKEVNTGNVISKVLTNGTDGPLYSDSSSGTYLLKPRGDNFVGIQRIAHEIFSDPYIKRENAKIEVLNGTKTSGKASELSTTLKSYGYNIVSTKNADETIQTTVIYDYTNSGKPYTVKFLKNRLSAPVISASRPEGSDLDISITIGQDFDGIE